MSSAVCQGLQPYLDPWPKLTTNKPYFPRALSCARNITPISDLNSEKSEQENNSNNKELENNNNGYSDFESNKNQLSSNGGDMGGWSFFQALVNTSQNPKAAEKEKEKSYNYIHPLVKRSSSQLSEKSLEMCTENLGSETGSAISEEEEEEMIKSSNSNKGRERPKLLVKQPTKAISCREIPPPLTTISGSNRVQMKTHREGGRLVMKAVMVPCSNSCFQAERGDGRLRLHLYKEYIQRFGSQDTEAAGAAAAAAAEEEEEEEEEEAEEEEAEAEAESEEEVEFEEDDLEERKEEEEEVGDVKYRGGKGRYGNNGNIGGEVEIGKRGRWRCNEGGGLRNNHLLIHQEPKPCWVATS